LRHGVGLHHAGLLPKYRVLVERLAQRGLLKVISGTDTLGVGVNVPIRTVLFTKLCKYDGEKTTLLNVRDFQQISGRAGRRGYDSRGLVVAQAPAHVIENLKLKAKASGDPKKTRKIVQKTPPPQGFVMWTQETFNKLIVSQPEPLVSRFQVSHGMLLNVLSRESDGCLAMKALVRSSHGALGSKKSSRRSSFEFFRALLDRKIIEYIPNPEPGTAKVRVHVDLQDDFSLNQALSLYLLDTIKLLDPQSELYASDILTLVESILENPDFILRKQLDRIKSAKMAELKASGMEFEERIEELEKLEYPKPNREFIYSTFNTFAAAHPWIGQENIRPKSIAREMYEVYHSFADYIREYDLHRVEGVLLRYLSEVYKVLVQSVPETSKTEEIRAIAIYFGTMIRQTDSSLLDDWEKMRLAAANPSAGANSLGSAKKSGPPSGASVVTEAPEAAPDITADQKSFTLLVRNEVFRFVRALSNRDYEEAISLIVPPSPEEISSGKILWTKDLVEIRMKEYAVDHGQIYIDPAARHPQHTQIVREPAIWKVEQRLIDSNDHNDWDLHFEVDLAASRNAGHVRMRLIGCEGVR
jgi:superfamily II RNA helicase